MEAQVLKLIMDYGLETVVIALAINMLTGISKLPLKAIAKKMEDGSKLTKYLVFLPLLWGLVLTLAYVKVRTGAVTWNKTFVTLWLTSSSLSLTLYAIFEKLFPSKAKILKDYEISANKKLIEEIRALTGVNSETSKETKKQKNESNISTLNQAKIEEGKQWKKPEIDNIGKIIVCKKQSNTLNKNG